MVLTSYSTTFPATGTVPSYISIPTIELVRSYLCSYPAGALIDVTVRGLADVIGRGKRAWGAISPALKRLERDGYIACLPTSSGTLVEVLEVSGVDACYDRGLDLLHLADSDRVLCDAALAGSLDDCRYQHPPLLWSWQTCAACAAAVVESGRGAWRGATVSEAAATIWAARSAAAYLYALALYEELARTADVGYRVAVRVLRDGVAVAVRVAEADWQRGVIVDSDPVGVPPTLAIEGWGIVDDAACITLDDSDDSDMLTAERVAADARTLLALLGAGVVLDLLPYRPQLQEYR